MSKQKRQQIDLHDARYHIHGSIFPKKKKKGKKRTLREES